MRVFAPAPFRYLGVDYPYGWQDMPQDLADTVLTLGYILGSEPKTSMPRISFLNASTTGTTVPSASGSGNGNYAKMLLDTRVLDTEGAGNLSASRIVVPSWASFVKITGHATFPQYGSGGPGHCSIHLFRNIGATPIYTPAGQAMTQAGLNFQLFGVGADSPTPEAHYHNRVSYPANANSYEYTSVLAVSPWIPVIALNESWTAYLWQNTGAPVTTSTNENWLSAEFR